MFVLFIFTISRGMNFVFVILIVIIITKYCFIWLIAHNTIINKVIPFCSSPCCSSGSFCLWSGRSQWTWTAPTQSHGFQGVLEDLVWEEDRLVAPSLGDSAGTLVALQEEEEIIGAPAVPLACTLREDTDPEEAVGRIAPLLQRGKSCLDGLHPFTDCTLFFTFSFQVPPLQLCGTAFV